MDVDKVIMNAKGATKMSNKNKATHSGTCQVCGNFQKLPGNVLSKHGYTKQWGFFNGVCWGAGSKPFEISIDLIEGAIARATETLEATRKESAELKAGKLIEGSTKAWQHVYRSFGSAGRGYSKGGYFWELVTVSGKESEPMSSGNTYWSFTYEMENNENTNKRPGELSAGYGDDRVTSVDGMRIKMNTGYATAHLDKHASQLADYIRWQQERILNWKATPEKLKPVTE